MPFVIMYSPTESREVVESVSGVLWLPLLFAANAPHRLSPSTAVCNVFDTPHEAYFAMNSIGMPTLPGYTPTVLTYAAACDTLRPIQAGLHPCLVVDPLGTMGHRRFLADRDTGEWTEDILLAHGYRVRDLAMDDLPRYTTGVHGQPVNYTAWRTLPYMGYKRRGRLAQFFIPPELYVIVARDADGNFGYFSESQRIPATTLMRATKYVSEAAVAGVIDAAYASLRQYARFQQLETVRVSLALDYAPPSPLLPPEATPQQEPIRGLGMPETTPGLLETYEADRARYAAAAALRQQDRVARSRLPSELQEVMTSLQAAAIDTTACVITCTSPEIDAVESLPYYVAGWPFDDNYAPYVAPYITQQLSLASRIPVTDVPEAIRQLSRPAMGWPATGVPQGSRFISQMIAPAVVAAARCDTRQYVLYSCSTSGERRYLRGTLAEIASNRINWAINASNATSLDLIVALTLQLTMRPHAADVQYAIARREDAEEMDAHDWDTPVQYVVLGHLPQGRRTDMFDLARFLTHDEQGTRLAVFAECATFASAEEAHRSVLLSASLFSFLEVMTYPKGAALAARLSASRAAEELRRQVPPPHTDRPLWIPGEDDTADPEPVRQTVTFDAISLGDTVIVPDDPEDYIPRIPLTVIYKLRPWVFALDASHRSVTVPPTVFSIDPEDIGRHIPANRTRLPPPGEPLRRRISLDES